ncbi:MAG TPA: sulfatase-like hydrolase/transferase, partial [Planctomycetota bacterium]|nr:sulfatase-like hydrolase/transferase [Planctomycetota bacterium]
AGSLVLGPDDRRYVEHVYEAGVARMDAAVGAVLEAIDRSVARSDVLVVLTSDHGEELFEHGGLNHGRTLHRELLHVPLIVRFPDGAPAGRQTGPASVLDIVPTVLELAGIPRPAGLPGVSLAQALAAERTRVACLHQDVLSVEHGAWKLIGAAPLPGDVQPPARLYDLAADRAELHDLAHGQPEQLDELRRRLGEFLDRWRPLVDEPTLAPASDAELQEQLRQLGYVGPR